MFPGRYSRQIHLEGVGEAGQKRLGSSSVLVVGLGGLGCASAPWLARAGVGRMILMDPGIVDEPDLGRQLLYTSSDLGVQKAKAAKQALSAMNPEIEVEALPLALTQENIAIIAKNVDLIIDGTDEIQPRLAMNSYSVASGKPVIFGGAVGWAGMVLTVAPGLPCRECVFADSPASAVCSEAGVLGPVVGWVGAIQAAEALRILLGRGPSGPGSLQTCDMLHSTQRRIKVSRNPSCPICGSG